jgi:hypothetical protein
VNGPIELAGALRTGAGRGEAGGPICDEGADRSS